MCFLRRRHVFRQDLEYVLAATLKKIIQFWIYARDEVPISYLIVYFCGFVGVIYSMRNTIGTTVDELSRNERFSGRFSFRNVIVASVIYLLYQWTFNEDYIFFPQWKCENIHTFLIFKFSVNFLYSATNSTYLFLVNKKLILPWNEPDIICISSLQIVNIKLNEDN